jgi:hypothetical protein
MLHDAEHTMVRELKKAFRPLNRQRGLINLRVSVKASPLPPIQMYVEEKLKQTTTCPECTQRYAVYGVSYHCPFCGGGTFAVHVRESASTIRVLAAEAARIGQEHGSAAHDSMLGDAYENAVSLFEGFLKLIYGYGIRKKFTPPETEQLENKVRTTFQRLDGAEELLRRDLTIELFRDVSQQDRRRLAAVFNRRHAITHNLGLVDKKYRDQLRAREKPGQEVSLNASEVIWAVDLIERRLLAVAAQVAL